MVQVMPFCLSLDSKILCLDLRGAQQSLVMHLPGVPMVSSLCVKCLCSRRAACGTSPQPWPIPGFPGGQQCQQHSVIGFEPLGLKMCHFLQLQWSSTCRKGCASSSAELSSNPSLHKWRFMSAVFRSEREEASCLSPREELSAERPASPRKCLGLWEHCVCLCDDEQGWREQELLQSKGGHCGWGC